LTDEALDRTLWRTRSGRGYGPVVRQTDNRMKGFIAVRPHQTRILSYFGIIC